MTLLDEALRCLSRGWSILPVHAGDQWDKDPHASVLIRTGHTKTDPDGTRRGAWKPLQTTPPTPEHVRVWFAREEHKGIALVTGAVSGRIVIDFDGQEGRAFAHSLGLRPHVQTGGGAHLHVRHPGYRVRNVVGKSSKAAPDCVDVRGDGGNAILPPTRTRKGPYVYLRDPDDPDDFGVLPVSLREALGLVPPVTQAAAAATGASSPLPAAGERASAKGILSWALAKLGTGGRNDTGNVLAWTLFNNGYSWEEVLAVGEQYVQQVGLLTRPEYTMEEFTATARSALSAPRGQPWGQPAARPRPVTKPLALEDIYAQLDDHDQTRGAYLLARDWAAQRRPVSDAVTYLRLLGHARATQTVRQAYRDHEAGGPSDGTLADFLRARRVRFVGGLDGVRRTVSEC